MGLRPIGESFSLALSRLRVARGFIRGIHDELIPTVSMRREWSDRERPLWMLTCQANGTSEWPSATITSAYDLAIHWISAGGFASGSAVNTTFTLGMPTLAYTPWLNGPLTWFPGVRPRVSGDVGNTAVITGTNPATNPLFGWQGANAPEAYRFLRFTEPFILPATMFLTLQCVTSARILVVNWAYREVGRGD